MLRSYSAGSLLLSLVSFGVSSTVGCSAQFTHSPGLGIFDIESGEVVRIGKSGGLGTFDYVLAVHESSRKFYSIQAAGQDLELQRISLDGQVLERWQLPFSRGAMDSSSQFALSPDHDAIIGLDFHNDLIKTSPEPWRI